MIKTAVHQSRCSLNKQFTLHIINFFFQLSKLRDGFYITYSGRTATISSRMNKQISNPQTSVNTSVNNVDSSTNISPQPGCSKNDKGENEDAATSSVQKSPQNNQQHQQQRKAVKRRKVELGEEVCSLYQCIFILKILS